VNKIKLLENSTDMMRDNLEIVASLRNSALAIRVWKVATLGFVFVNIPICLMAGSDETIIGKTLFVIAIPWVCAALMWGITRLLQGALNVIYNVYYLGQKLRIRSITDISGDYVTDEQILNQFNELDDKIQAQRSDVERLQPWFTWMERLTIIFFCVAFLGSVIYTIILIMGY
jgi:hypothetical protein